MTLRIVVGVSGGIAAYKAVALVRLFVRDGHFVQVVPTDAALKFVGAPTWEAISRTPLQTSLYDGVAEVRHVAIGQEADLVVIAPATANTLAKMAAGIADDLLGNVLLATEAPVVVAPAMHTEMWRNAATQHNAATLKGRGVRFVGPASGPLTGKDSGEGRMSEPEEIRDAAYAAVGGTEPEARDLAGKRVIVSAGGTREPLDPVRFLGNRSSGKQGVAIAARAAARGADVMLVAANIEVPVPRGVHVLRVATALELETAMLNEARHADVVIMAAAVADYRPAAYAPHKIKKAGDEGLTLELEQNPDIVRSLISERGENARPVIVAFAAETADGEALEAIVRDKAARKGADLLVVNRVGESLGFGADENRVSIRTVTGDEVAAAAGSKMSVADTILDAAREIEN